MTGFLTIALALVISVLLAFFFVPTPGDRDTPPGRLQQGGNWSELEDDAPDDDGC